MSDSLYSKYLKERTSDSILETQEGFATFRIMNSGKSVYIVDLYVLPDYRKSGVAASIADKICDIAKEQGCIELLGSVVPSSKGSTASLKVLLGYGMELLSSSQDFIVFKKGL
jgi:GNAT superfamily N-acetyltransferase